MAQASLQNIVGALRNTYDQENKLACENVNVLSKTYKEKFVAVEQNPLKNVQSYVFGKLDNYTTGIKADVGEWWCMHSLTELQKYTDIIEPKPVKKKNIFGFALKR